MAGDWLKMEAATPDKPEVLAIAAKMGWDDPDLAVGKLFRVWRWFDQHSTGGNAHGVTLALLDRIAGVTGFSAAMLSVGWLAVSDDGVSLPNFDRHCGKTAKERAQTAKRVASHKGNAKGNDKGNADTVTKSVPNALPREEKRREGKEEKRPASDDASSAQKSEAQGHRIPDDWDLTPELSAWAIGKRPDLDVRREADNFRDYWQSKPGKDGRKTNWTATFRYWIRNSRNGAVGRQQSQQGGSRAASRDLL